MKTKLSKVLKFVRARHSFTSKEFVKHNKCHYPCAETNYLRMLVVAGYVNHTSKGKYTVFNNPRGNMSYRDLKEEAYE